MRLPTSTKNMLTVVLLTVGAAAAVGTAVASSPDRTPLQNYPGFGADPQAEEAQFANEEMQREQLVSECMREAGFRYTPRPPSVSMTGNEWDGLPDEEVERILAERAANPNDAYVASLSAAERERYWTTLIGVADPVRPEETPVPLDLDGDGTVTHDEKFGVGCAADAHRAVPGVYELPGLLADELRTLDADVAADARTVDARGRWVACMNGSGFEGASWEQVHEAVEVAYAEDQDSDVRERFDDADAECADTYADTVRDVRAEHEHRFVQEHRDVLEARRGR